MFEKRLEDVPAGPEWDRRPILINVALSQEGIAASLRRAFGTVQTAATTDRDFEELLARLS